MTTTRKDIYRIADAFAESKPQTNPSELEGGYEERHGQHSQWLADINRVADALNITSGFNANGNRRFDYEKFYELCGAR